MAAYTLQLYNQILRRMIRLSSYLQSNLKWNQKLKNLHFQLIKIKIERAGFLGHLKSSHG